MSEIPFFLSLPQPLKTKRGNWKKIVGMCCVSKDYGRCGWMEGSSERALEVAPNETLVMGHETTFQNSHDVFENCAKHGES